MNVYDIRDAGTGCINNAALALLDILSRGEPKIKIIANAQDIPKNILETVAKTYGYTVVDASEGDGVITAILERRQ